MNIEKIQKTEKELHDGRIVNLRALAILLVVFGHSIILYQNGWSLYTTDYKVPVLNLVKRIIDLLQMPLFFSLSGYLFEKSYRRNHFLPLIMKKIKRLIVPFVAFSFLWMIPIRFLVRYKGYIGKTPLEIIWNCTVLGNDNGHLWYLPCLFVCFILTYILMRGLDKLIENTTIKMGILFVTSYMFSYFFYLLQGFLGVEIARAVAIYWVWFCIGFIMATYCFPEKFVRYKYILLVLSAVLLTLTTKNIFTYTALVRIICLTALYTNISVKINRMTEFISRNSFGLYLFHSPLVYITYSSISNVNPVIVVGLNFLVFGGISILLVLLLRITEMRFLMGE